MEQTPPTPSTAVSPGHSGVEHMEGLEVSWQVLEEGRAVRVQLRLQDSGTQETCVLTQQSSWYHFRLMNGRQDVQGRVELRLDRRAAWLRGSIQLNPYKIFDGSIATWLLEAPPTPWRRPATGGGVCITGPGASREVFSFLLTGAAEAEQRARADLEPRLIRCHTPSELPLYEELEKLRGQAGAAAGMRERAAAFRASTEYLRELAALPEPLPRLQELWWRLWRLEGPLSLESLSAEVAEVLGLKLEELWKREDIQQAWRRLWQSAFALALAAPPGAPEAASLVLALRVLGLLKRLEAGEERLGQEPFRRQALQALVVLPEAVTPPAPTGAASALPGLGRLARIRQQLARYEPGEIAMTESLMPHEWRASVARELSRATASTLSSSEGQGLRHEATHTEQDSELQSALAELLAAQSLTREWKVEHQYQSDGLSKASTGKASKDSNPRARERRLATELARRSIHLAASRLSHRVQEQRHLRLLEEQERMLRREIDNRAGTTPLLGIYRWLRKVITLTLEGCGARLIAELLISSPAEGYRRALEQQAPVLAAPTPLEALTPPIRSHEEVNAQNYLVLATRYGVAGLSAPPEKTRQVRMSLQRQVAGPQELCLPEGHVPTGVEVHWLIGNGAHGLVGFVGGFEFKYTPPAPGQGTPATAPSDPLAPPQLPVPAQGKAQGKGAEVGAVPGPIPVAVLCGAEDFTVGIVLSCERIGHEEHYTTWQLHAYQALQAGYSAQLQSYQANLRERIHRSSQGRRRELEQEQLRSRGLELLWQRCTQGAADRPTCLRFLERLFEWREMAYRFHTWEVGTPQAPGSRWPGESLPPAESDALFESFLSAGSARVLVPVEPGHELEALYYFTFGTLPPWEAQAPLIAAQDVGVLAALLALQAEQEEPESWSEELPTSLLLLQQGTSLEGGQP